MEVMEEEELMNMRQQQERFEQIRNVELAETQRLEEAEKRRVEEKERRVEQEKERLEREKAATEKVAARTFTQGFLAQLQSSVVQNLQDAGYFYDPLEDEVSTQFMPWLMDSMQENLDSLTTARAIADELISAAAARQNQMVEEASAARKAAAQAKLDAIAEAKAEREAKAAREEAERLAAEAAAAEAAAQDETASPTEDA